MKGRRPKPEALKILAGTHRPGRTNSKAPKIDPNWPRPTRDMTPEERVAWRWVQKVIDPLRVTSTADQAAVKLLVRQLVRWERALAELATRGEYYEVDTPTGTLIKPHPALAVAASLEKSIRQLLVEFGLTPASRSKVNTAETKAADPLERIREFAKARR